MARTGGEIKVSMRRLYLSWGLVKKEVTKGRMCQRVRRLGNGMGKDVSHVSISGTGEQLCEAIELVISVKKIGELRGVGASPRPSLELTLGISEHSLGSIPVPHPLLWLLFLK